MKLFEREHPVKVYRHYDNTTEEIVKITDDLSLVRDLERVKSLAIQHRDQSAYDAGTCVLGAGIKMKVFYPRKKHPTNLILFRQPFQGNIGSYKALKPVLEYLNKEFPQLRAFWDDGNMD